MATDLKHLSYLESLGEWAANQAMSAYGATKTRLPGAIAGRLTGERRSRATLRPFPPSSPIEQRPGALATLTAAAIDPEYAVARLGDAFEGPVRAHGGPLLGTLAPGNFARAGVHTRIYWALNALFART